jgi:hypothetical protein
MKILYAIQGTGNGHICRAAELIPEFEKYGEVPFKPGRGFILDLGIKHCVINQSNEDRYHIIVHGRSTKKIENLIELSIGKL